MQDESFMRQSRRFFLNVLKNTSYMRDIKQASVFLQDNRADVMSVLEVRQSIEGIQEEEEIAFHKVLCILKAKIGLLVLFWVLFF